ncbi:hypothetical protein PQU92_03625 [Asticcacaulis sp. BYS171W]|uniref:UrcA family protein n=1 Tax=Asticcacaulis aquaticus TaxID=2984212 RepID=A0ABT5HQN2_9CAUL|nr:hypothetical protein [Asticcacaulis aquaticus]MDC7682349.1 hypothetical protein [Asticcacaulis aquaticus]
MKTAATITLLALGLSTPLMAAESTLKAREAEAIALHKKDQELAYKIEDDFKRGDKATACAGLRQSVEQRRWIATTVAGIQAELKSGKASAADIAAFPQIDENVEATALNLKHVEQDLASKCG